jgi:hypothetical protein
MPLVTKTVVWNEVVLKTTLLGRALGRAHKMCDQCDQQQLYQYHFWKSDEVDFVNFELMIFFW